MIVFLVVNFLHFNMKCKEGLSVFLIYTATLAPHGQYDYEMPVICILVWATE